MRNKKMSLTNINLEKQKIQDEALEALKVNDFYGGIVLPTGTGKTQVLVNSIKIINPASCLYTCDNVGLRDKDFPAELEKWGGGHLSDVIRRLCYQSAYKLKDEYYDTLLMDEGDYAITPEYIKLLDNNEFKHIIFASATLPDDKRKVIENYFPIVYEKQVKDVEDSSVINKANLYFVNFMLNRFENNKYLAYNETFKRILGNNYGNVSGYDREKLQFVTRNRKIFLSKLDSAKDVCQKLIAKLYKNPSNKILIFCSLSEQADRICKYSYHTKNHKENPYLDLFDTGSLRVLAVVGKIDRGRNLIGVNNVIFESPYESKTKMTQKSGRARRLDIDETSDFYFLIPFYKDRKGNIKPTIVQKWVLNATKDFNQNFKIINL